ncbi:MAG: 2-oxoacid:acceptor oxidoreductase family protein [Dehalococcoidia bacterium]|nr:2-oxoacid:acceptor oxidoreductase family protein [Dehalococcoidia bacterium]
MTMNKSFTVMIGGLGGQGALLFGRLLAEAGMAKYKNVLFFPNYGGLVRGGASECTVVLSDDNIASPVALEIEAAIAMSIPSLQSYERRLRPGGVLFFDKAVTPGKIGRQDIKVVDIPATQVAIELGDSRAANLIFLGAYLKATSVGSVELVDKVLEKKLGGGRREALLNLDKKALRRGTELV